MILIHECINSKTDFKLSDIVIEFIANNGRSGKLSLHQTYHANRVSDGLFAHRAIADWNNKPAGIAETAFLACFKLKCIYTLSHVQNFID